MSSKRLDDLGDYHRHGYRLSVECRQCNRVVILDPLPMLEQCQRRRWSRQMPAVGRRLRCSNCGARNVRVGPAFGSRPLTI